MDFKVERVLSIQIREGKGAFDSYTNLFETHDGLMQYEMSPQAHQNGHLLKACFASLATEYILRGNDKDVIMAQGLAITIVNIEQAEVGASYTFNRMLSISRDLDEGGKRTVTKFIHKKIDCDCLKEKYKESKKLPNVGNCENCQKQMERSKLFACKDAK